MPVEYSNPSAIIFFSSACPFWSESLKAIICPVRSPTKIVPFLPWAIWRGELKFLANIETETESETEDEDDTISDNDSEEYTSDSDNMVEIIQILNSSDESNSD